MYAYEVPADGRTEQFREERRHRQARRVQVQTVDGPPALPARGGFVPSSPDDPPGYMYAYAVPVAVTVRPHGGDRVQVCTANDATCASDRSRLTCSP